MARTPSKINDLRDAGAHVMALDVTAPQSTIESVAHEVEKTFGGVDYLIPVAGYILDAAVEEATPEEEQAQFGTKVLGTTNVIRVFLPMMRKQAVRSGGDAAATYGLRGIWESGELGGGASYSGYAMTKACMSSLAESLRAELAGFGIAATVVEPGYFRTGFLNKSAGANVTGKVRLEVYEDPGSATGKVRKGLKEVVGKQLGDVKKGARVVVDVLTGTGVAEGKKEIPLRIVLGSDSEGVIRGKCESVLEYLAGGR